MIGDRVSRSSSLDIHIPPETNSACIFFRPLACHRYHRSSLFQNPLPPTRGRIHPGRRNHQLDARWSHPNPIRAPAANFLRHLRSPFPAEALRSWDGAHTGPHGERHGLKHLLDAVEEYQIPTVLLDLKEPENLSALDAMGILPQIDALANNSLLILPESEQMLPAEKNQGTNDFQFVHLQDHCSRLLPFPARSRSLLVDGA